MIALISLALNLLAAFFKSKSRLEAENAALRQQLIVLQRKVRGRVLFDNGDRLLFVQLYRWFPSILEAMRIIRPQTLVRWHRAGFRGYWRWKSRSPGGRPPIRMELQALIRRLSLENPLWGAPRIHGELLKLGFAVSQSTVAKYVARKSDPPDQSWSTFVRNHAPQMAAMDLFVVPTIGFQLLYAFVIVRLAQAAAELPRQAPRRSARILIQFPNHTRDRGRAIRTRNCGRGDASARHLAAAPQKPILTHPRQHA
jgi:hypothetical protein